MFQPDDPTVASTMPTPSTAGTQGWYTDGNASTGQAATIVRADQLNMITAELINIVEAAGITPSKTTFNQCVTAINSLISTAIAGITPSTVQSLVANGYQKLSSGLLIQWGSYSISNGNGTCNFPITFSSQCFAVLLTQNTEWAQVSAGANVVSKSQFGITNNTDGTAHADSFQMLAIGV